MDTIVFSAADHLVKENALNGFHAKLHLLATAPRGEGGGNKQLYCTDSITTCQHLFYVLMPNKNNQKSWCKKEKKNANKNPHILEHSNSSPQLILQL